MVFPPVSTHAMLSAHATSASSSTFPQTRWSMVLSAQADDPAALAELCRAYWYPLYCFARRLVSDPADAEDLTQGFFATLLSRDGIRLASAERGRMRSFLLAGLKNHAMELHRRGTAQKRGGGQALVEFDAMEAEQRYALEPRDDQSPEREFDRAWARQLLDAVLARMAAIYTAGGKSDLFLALRDHLTSGETADFAAIGTQFGLSPGRVRLAAFKLRERYRELLREIIRETVTTDAEVEDELQYLRGLFEA